MGHVEWRQEQQGPAGRQRRRQREQLNRAGAPPSLDERPPPLGLARAAGAHNKRHAPLHGRGHPNRGRPQPAAAKGQRSAHHGPHRRRESTLCGRWPASGPRRRGPRRCRRRRAPRLCRSGRSRRRPAHCGSRRRIQVLSCLVAAHMSCLAAAHGNRSITSSSSGSRYQDFSTPSASARCACALTPPLPPLPATPPAPPRLKVLHRQQRQQRRQQQQVAPPQTSRPASCRGSPLHACCARRPSSRFSTSPRAR